MTKLTQLERIAKVEVKAETNKEDIHTLFDVTGKHETAVIEMGLVQRGQRWITAAVILGAITMFFGLIGTVIGHWLLITKDNQKTSTPVRTEITEKANNQVNQ